MDKDALAKLIAAVEAGTAQAYDFAKAIPAAPPEYGFSPEAFKAYDAYRGSLDAAKALHDALLPGWEWHLDAGDGAYVENRGDFGNTFSADASVGNIARAWLLAILRAKAAE